MFTMGTDFKYQYAESWFRQMDKLIHYVNKVKDGSEVGIFLYLVFCSIVIFFSWKGYIPGLRIDGSIDTQTSILLWSFNPNT
jgi:hypothetical protein